MDWETMSAVILILKAPLEDRDRPPKGTKLYSPLFGEVELKVVTQ